MILLILYTLSILEDTIVRISLRFVPHIYFTILYL